MLEVLLVVAIFGIIVYLAVPNFDSAMSNTKATEAKWQLNHLYSLQKSFYYTNSKYADGIEEVGFEQAQLVTNGGNANYEIQITEAGIDGWRATATAVVDFDQDGNINVWQIDHTKTLTEITKD